MTNWLTALRAGAHQLHLTLTTEQEDRFARFLTLLLERNRQFNLTAITDPLEVAVKHFVDSLTVETIWHPRHDERLIDIGAGAGFPGIPLAIRYPGTEIVLNDSTSKKVEFLREVAEALALPHVRPLWARAEALGRDPRYRGYFHTVTARALAHLGLLCEYALPLLTVGGRLIAMKGPGGAREVEESAPALAQLGGAVDTVHHLTLGDAGERLLIVIRAVRPTPAPFPRDAGAAKKRPLFTVRDA